MKLIFTSCFSLLLLQSFAQVTINSANLPDQGDTLITESALLLGNVDLEDTGSDHSWIFGEDILQPTGFLSTTPCLAEDDAPFLYQVLFNNPFYPEYNADFAFGVDDFTILAITFSDNYWFYQNNDDSYNSVGFGTTINDVPLPTTIDPIDVIYELPIEFGNSNSSYSEMNIEVPTIGSYGLQQTRSNMVDGWGTLNLWGTDYEVLRVRTEIEASDSVYIEFFGVGQTIDRPLAVEYKWLSPDYNVPVLQINTSAGFVTTVNTIHIEEEVESIGELMIQQLMLSPNPSSNFVQLNYTGFESGILSIYNSNGKLEIQQSTNGNNLIDVSSLQSGQYTFVVNMIDSEKSLIGRAVIE